MTTNEVRFSFEFKKLLIALRHTDSGFLCFTTPSAENQPDAAVMISSQPDMRQTVYIDCSFEKPFHGFEFIRRAFQKQPSAEVLILFNFQNLTESEKDNGFFQTLNLSRDTLTGLSKLIIFGMTYDFEKKLMLNAPDFYSFLYAKFHFDLQPRKEYAIQIATRYDEPSILFMQNTKIIENRYKRLKVDVSKLLHGVLLEIPAPAEQQLFDFLSAWADISIMVPSILPRLVSKVITALQETERLWGNSLSRAYKYEIIARAFDRLKKYAEAVLYWGKALKLYEKIQGEGYRAAVLPCSSIASCLYEQGKYPAAMEWSEKALSIQQLSSETPDIAERYFQLGLIAEKRNFFSLANDRFNTALVFSRKYNDLQMSAKICHQLSIIFYKAKDYFTAEFFCKEAFNYMPDYLNNYGSSGTVHQLGVIAEHTQNMEEAVKLYNRALEMSLNSGNERVAAGAYHQLGNISLKRGDYEAAESWYYKSLEIKRKIRDDKNTAITFRQLSMLAQDRGNINAADAFYKKARKIMKKYGDG